MSKSDDWPSTRFEHFGGPQGTAELRGTQRRCGLGEFADVGGFGSCQCGLGTDTWRPKCGSHQVAGGRYPRMARPVTGRAATIAADVHDISATTIHG